ncbi:DUF3017 domain-containing protein [Streptomyces cinnamoneus]|uniref:DUF3017 domain-containing protein n=1 Tax=Streptomyces cinnamoneus TaxID=53446 RepID=UPI00378D4422
MSGENGAGATEGTGKAAGENGAAVTGETAEGAAGANGVSAKNGVGAEAGAGVTEGTGDAADAPAVGKSSRRPPRVTRDTARPEGGGRAAPGGAPAPARQWPLLAVFGATGLGLLIVAFDAFRVGTLLIGLAMLGGAALRWALPSVGMLAVRSRFTDIATYGGLGVAIVLLALMAQPHAWLKLPFLEDVLHFTVR